jgi:hypothetical protein
MRQLLLAVVQRNRQDLRRRTRGDGQAY